LWDDTAKSAQAGKKAPVTPAVVDASWGQVAAALCASWNLFAVDLQDEPYLGGWGQGWAETDWRLAAEHIGNLVHRACPRWLVMVEGIGTKPGAVGQSPDAGPFFWGSNLMGAHAAPLQLSDSTRLLYAPIVSGPAVYDSMPCFADGRFPQNMPDVWGDLPGFEPRLVAHF
jgi:endoglucanase